jgi:anhydro-N-acetylmuramic acid kinase
MIERRRRPADEELADVDRELSEFFAMAAWGLLEVAGVEASEVRALGSHGQTVWHHPASQNPESIQLGDPARIARLLGITTVGHFRQADIQAGGQGAPLAPLLHRAMLKPAHGIRAVVNIGGIANVSLIDANGHVSGYDTGPGNCLLDAWVKKHRGSDYDHQGQWAAGGQVDRLLLDTLLADPYLSMPPPKSTGVEYFNYFWLQGRLEQRLSSPLQADFEASVQDVQATLSEFTAHTIAEALLATSAEELLVCGGGTHNLDLLNRLRRLLPGMPVDSTAAKGIDPDWMEAVLFAWLAREHLAGRKQETGPITGARHPVLLGEAFQPPGA